MNYKPVTQDILFSSSFKDSPGDGFKPSGEEEKKDAKDPEKEDNEVLSTEKPRVNQENYANVNGTNNINIVSLTANAASIKDNVVDKDIVYRCANDPNMPNLEEINYSDDDEDVGAEADMTNLDSNIPARLHSRRGNRYDEVFAPVARIEDEVYVCQPPGFEDPEFLDRVYKTASTPMEISKPLLKDENAKDVDVHLYRSTIGSLMYLTSSRPDIMFAVCARVRFQVTPKVSHLYAVKRIFRHLKGQPKLGLWYPKDSPFDLEAYTDSDYAGASLDRFVQVFLDKQVKGMFKHKEIYVTPSHTKKTSVPTEVVTDEAVYEEMYNDVKKAATTATGLDTKKPRRKDTELSQTSVPTEVVTDEAVYEEMYNDVKKAATTATGLDTIKTNQALEIGSLKRNVKKKASKRTHKLNRLYKIGSSKRIEYLDKASLGDQEDASKQGRIIDNLDADEGVTLVDETQGRNDQDIFDTSVLDDEEVVNEKEVSTVDPVTTAGVEVSAAATTPTIFMDDIRLAKALAALKSAKPMVKKPKEESLKRQKEEEANIALIAKWVDVQAMMDADHKPAKRLQVEKKGKLTIEERSKLFVELKNKRKKHFARLSAEEKWRKPPTKAQKRNQMCSETRAEGSSKRAGEELESNKAKKQKLDEKVEVEEDNDQEEAEIKMYMKIISDDEIALDVIPLATKPPIIVDWKIIKEGKISFYHIIRHDGSSKRFSLMIQMLQNIDREDL
nr:hypothetical protein [Tanacetum cinerariifolium]